MRTIKITTALLTAIYMLSASFLFAQTVPNADGKLAYDAAPAPASSATKTTIAELQQLALKNHPSLKLAEALEEAERGTREQAGTRPNPTIGYDAEEIGTGGKAGKQGMRVEQPIGDGARRQALVNASDRALNVLEWERTIAVAKIENDVRLAARKVVIASEKVEFRRQLAELSSKLENQARTAIESGSVEIGRFDYIRLQNQARQANLALAQEINKKTAADKALSALVGAEDVVWTIEDDEIDDKDPALDENETLDDLLQNSPALMKLRAEIEQKRAVLNYERTPKREASLQGGVAYNYSDSTTIANVGFGAPLRISDRNAGNIRRATGEYYAAQRKLERAELKLRTEVADVFAVYKNAREEVQTYRERILPDLESLFTMSRQAYAQGAVNFLELSDARKSYVEASIGYLDALERLAESTVKLEGAMLLQSLEDDE